MSIRIKVLNYINDNQEGVRISDMEQTLGEKRMMLGYVTQSLLNEGKIVKIEDCYYPKKTTKKMIL